MATATRQQLLRTCAAAMIVMASIQAATAIYAPVDVENVPVARLISNLERLSTENPDDGDLLANLARAHAMAYATSAQELPVNRNNPRRGVWFGRGAGVAPFPAREQPAEDEALSHLRQAASYFDAALKVDPGNPYALLGRPWCLIELGRTDEAMTSLRQLIETVEDRYPQRGFWAREGLISEAIDYLIPLLGPDDAEEALALRLRQEELARTPRGVSPIAVPIRDGLSAIDVVSSDARVPFDLDGSGSTRQWEWITQDAAWLVYDQRGNDAVTSGLQLFGNVTFWMFWDHGYQALGALDDDSDGRLRGRELAHLKLWRDTDMDGVSDPGEVQPLDAWGIVELSTSSEWDAGHPDEIAWSPDGVRFADGTVRPTWDLILHSAPVRPPWCLAHGTGRWCAMFPPFRE